MEKIRLINFYRRELERVNRFDILRTADENQRLAYDIDGEYSEEQRIRYAINAIESNYHNCGADNLDFADQITLFNYIQKLKEILKDYDKNPNTNYSIEIIEEIITLVNIYLGMQVHHYPAFTRLIRKKYIENELLSQNNYSEFEIPDFETTVAILSKLELDNKNNPPKEEREQIIRRYEKELEKLDKYTRGRDDIYKNEYNFETEEERTEKLVTNIKSINKKLFNRIMKSKFPHSKQEELINFIKDLEYAIYNYQDYSSTVLEMMIEIANILFNMDVKNPKAFQLLVENNFFEDYMIADNEIIIHSFEETYDILKRYIKRF